MSNNKQSSVEWIINKCACADLLTELNDDKISLKQFEIRYIELLQQAKAMHKEEIIDALLFGDVLFPLTAENYYNETFKGKE